MLQTRLWLSIKSLPAAKKNGFEKFLASPYFNQRKDLTLLYGIIKKALNEEIELTKEAAWKAVFPQTKIYRIQPSAFDELFTTFV